MAAPRVRCATFRARGLRTIQSTAVRSALVEGFGACPGPGQEADDDCDVMPSHRTHSRLRSSWPSRPESELRVPGILAAAFCAWPVHRERVIAPTCSQTCARVAWTRISARIPGRRSGWISARFIQLAMAFRVSRMRPCAEVCGKECFPGDFRVFALNPKCSKAFSGMHELTITFI